MNSADTDHVANYIEDNPTFTGKLTHTKSGNVFYLYNGKQHREDGPAVITQYYTEWHIHGRLHRMDGPARIWPDGMVEWWLNGNYYRTKQEYKLAVREYKLNTFLSNDT